MNYMQDFKKSHNEIRFVQANVTVPKRDRARMVALGLKLRAQYLVQLVDSKNIDAIFAVAALNMPKLPKYSTVIDAQKAWVDHGPIAQVLGVAYNYLLKSQRELGLVQTEKRDSDRYIIAHAKAVAYGKLAEAAYREFEILSEEAELEVEEADE